MACRRSAVRSRLAPPRLHGNRAASPGSPVKTSPSSRGLGHYPFTVATGVRIPVGTPPKKPGPGRVSFCPDCANEKQASPPDAFGSCKHVRAQFCTEQGTTRDPARIRACRLGRLRTIQARELWSADSVECPVHSLSMLRAGAAVNLPPCLSAPSCCASCCALHWRSTARRWPWQRSTQRTAPSWPRTSMRRPLRRGRATWRACPVTTWGRMAWPRAWIRQVTRVEAHRPNPIAARTAASARARTVLQAPACRCMRFPSSTRQRLLPRDVRTATRRRCCLT